MLLSFSSKPISQFLAESAHAQNLKSFLDVSTGAFSDYNVAGRRERVKDTRYFQGLYTSLFVVALFCYIVGCS